MFQVQLIRLIFFVFLSSSGSVDSIFWIQRLCAHCKALLSSHRLSMGNSHPTLVQRGTFSFSSNFKVLKLFLFAQFKICRRKIQLTIYSKSDFIQPVHLSQIPQEGENGQNVAFFIFLKLFCDQTVWFFQLFSTALKGFCSLNSENAFILVLAIFSI